MIEGRDIWYSFRFGGESTPALRGASLKLEKGEYVALVGANGSGKTTLGELLCGLLSPDQGEIEVDGKTFSGNRGELRGRVGMVFQNPDTQFFCETVGEEVTFGPENLGFPSHECRRRGEEALDWVGLASSWRRSPLRLSAGEKRLVALASVLSMGTKYLILDEPAGFLDAVGRKRLMDVVGRLKERGFGLLYITQHMEEILQADRMVILEEGRTVFQGTLPDFFALHGDAVRFRVDIPPIPLLIRKLKEMGCPVRGEALTLEEALEEIREVWL